MSNGRKQNKEINIHLKAQCNTIQYEKASTLILHKRERFPFIPMRTIGEWEIIKWNGKCSMDTFFEKAYTKGIQ